MGKITGREMTRRLEAAISDGVNRDNFDERLELLFESEDLIKSHRQWLKNVGDALNVLQDALASYARRARVSIFNAEPLHEIPGGGMQGIHESTDGTRATLTVSPTDYRRTNPGDVFTQQFLETLPKGWRTTKQTLDINSLADVEACDLASHGMVRLEKNRWTKSCNVGGVEL